MGRAQGRFQKSACLTVDRMMTSALRACALSVSPLRHPLHLHINHPAMALMPLVPHYVCLMLGPSGMKHQHHLTGDCTRRHGMEWKSACRENTGKHAALCSTVANADYHTLNHACPCPCMHDDDHTLTPIYFEWRKIRTWDHNFQKNYL